MRIGVRAGSCWLVMLVVFLGVGILGSLSTQCPFTPPSGEGEGEGQSTSRATFLVSNQTVGKALLAQGGGEVDVENLTVEITKIELDREGSGATESEGEVESEQGVEGESGDNQGSKVVVFEGSATVDVVQLQDLSQILTTSDIPAGTYTKIRLSIQNPHAVLVGGEEVTSDQIQLTANGRLFISKTFIVPTEPVVILLSFNGVHLVRTGQQDRFVLTPQLRAEISVQSAQVTVDGTIQSVNSTDQEIVVLPSSDPESEGVTVKVTSETEITINGSPATFADLTVGLGVTVQGTIDALGVVTADVISMPVETEAGEGEGGEGEEPAVEEQGE